MSLPQELQYLKSSTQPNASRSRAQSISPTPQVHPSSRPSTKSPVSSIHPAFRTPPPMITDRTPRSPPHHPSRATTTSPSDTISPLSPSRGTTPISPSFLHPALRTPSSATVRHALPIHNPSALRQSGRVKVVDIPAPLNIVHEVITQPLSHPQRKPLPPSAAKTLPLSASAAFIPAKPARNPSAATLPSTIGVLDHQPPTTATTITATGLNASPPKVLPNPPGIKAPPPSIECPTGKYLHARAAPKPPRPLKNRILELIRETSRQLIASLTNGSWKKMPPTDEEKGLGAQNLAREEPTTPPLTPRRVKKKDISSPIQHDRLPFHVATTLGNETRTIRGLPAPAVPPRNPSRSRTRNTTANRTEAQRSKSKDKEKEMGEKVTKQKISSPRLHHKEDKEKGKGLSTEPASMGDGRPLAAAPSAPPTARPAAPVGALSMPIHTGISRSKSKIVRDAKKRSRRPVLERVVAAFLPPKKDVNDENSPLERVPSPRTLYKSTLSWTAQGCGQAWDIHDILILTSALLIILFLIVFIIWVSIVALQNPHLGNGAGLSMGDAEGMWESGGGGHGSNIYGGEGIKGAPEVVSSISAHLPEAQETVVPSVGTEFRETVGWIGATMTTAVATTMATGVRSVPTEAKSSATGVVSLKSAFVAPASPKSTPTVEPRDGGVCKVNGGTLAGWRFTPNGCVGDDE